MRIHSFLTQGPSALPTLTTQLTQLSSSISSPIDALALFHLGFPRDQVASAILASGIACPNIYLADSYGIIGYDETLGRNVELMEKGRGKEYGYVGGSGGEGCVAVLFSSGAVAGHGDMEFPSDLASMMTVEDVSNTFTNKVADPPVHYGGVSKENYVMNENGELTQTPYFWVGSKENDLPVGISTFTGEAADACKDLIDKLPTDYNLSGDVGLFPCYTRGVNHYGKEDVESSAIAASTENARVFGMFAHGELGPSTFSGFVDKATKIPCEKHSMTSILSIHCKD